MVHGQPPAQEIRVQQLPVELDLVPVLDLGEPLRHDSIDHLFLRGRGQVQAVSGATGQGFPASAAREDEID